MPTWAITCESQLVAKQRRRDIAIWPSLIKSVNYAILGPLDTLVDFPLNTLLKANHKLVFKTPASTWWKRKVPKSPYQLFLQVSYCVKTPISKICQKMSQQRTVLSGIFDNVCQYSLADLTHFMEGSMQDAINPSYWGHYFVANVNYRELAVQEISPSIHPALFCINWPDKTG